MTPSQPTFLSEVKYFSCTGYNCAKATNCAFSKNVSRDLPNVTVCVAATMKCFVDVNVIK